MSAANPTLRQCVVCRNAKATWNFLVDGMDDLPELVVRLFTAADLLAELVPELLDAVGTCPVAVCPSLDMHRDPHGDTCPLGRAITLLPQLEKDLGE